ncbi:hypothetical protein M1771_03990 [Spiroplasma citri]|uniref:DUF3137 domain-containing protein n=1 Tax=Spiroplasma citri TaxID=2133 RepID=A0AAX3T0N4_SPICI|nr:hypothetical protein [Spiroplasma citri]WFG97171.1 hypothetical protein M0C40_04005 [Spiroplasma citri]WFH01068.1 hypothetical protein M1771_03990 [Spiroplasma citri]
MIEKLRNNDWKIVSRKIINDQLQEYYHNNISFQPPRKRLQLNYSLNDVFRILFSIMGIFIMILFVVKNIKITLIWIPFLMFLIGIVLIIIVCYYIVKWTRLLKLSDKIMDKIDLVTIYNLALGEYFTSELTLLRINKIFKPLPTDLINFNNNTKIDFFNLTYSSGNISFETITHKVPTKINNKIDKEEFYRIPILTVQPHHKLTVQFTIQPRGVTTKFFNPLNYINLQDNLFEEKFLVGGTSERAIKAILTPQVRKNLFILARKAPTIPAIDADEGVLTLLFQSYLVKSWNDKTMALTTVEFSGKFDNIIQDILSKIETAIIWLKNVLHD